MPSLPIRPVDAPLYVVTPIANPSRYRSRYTLYRDFEKYIGDAGAILHTVEAAYGDRDFVVTDAANPRHIQVRTHHEVWHKENLINIGVSRLPADWKYVAWIDADVQFARPDIVTETIHQLQHFSVVQMFAHATDLGPKHEPLKSFEGFVAQWVRNTPSVPGGDGAIQRLASRLRLGLPARRLGSSRRIARFRHRRVRRPLHGLRPDR